MFARREFIKRFSACAALLGAQACVMPRGVSRFDAPDLRFGVLSDIHLHTPGDENTFLTALKFFRDRGVDAVLIAGDIADRGQIAQLCRCGDCWRKVFPDNRAPDGRPVEKLFIYGNHDWYHWRVGVSKSQLEDSQYLSGCLTDENRAAAWKRAFDEEYEPIWMKTVRGHVFVGAHWGHMKDMPAFLAAHRQEIDPQKPFFYTQHAHPKDTCMGAWAWGHDDGTSTKALSAFPNAVAFSGHSHYTLTDERSVWQGTFTSINTASLRYASADYSLRENFGGNSSGYSGEKRKHVMRGLGTNEGRQGMVVSVYGNTLSIERRDFVKGKSLGDDWIVSVPGGADSSFAARAARRSAPQFEAGSRPRATVADGLVTVAFPPARTVDKCRVYEYEVTATLIEDDVDLVQAQRRVMAPDFFLPETPQGVPGTCVFSLAELPCAGHYVFSVRPVECFGKKGEPIVSAPFVLMASGRSQDQR